MIDLPLDGARMFFPYCLIRKVASSEVNPSGDDSKSSHSSATDMLPQSDEVALKVKGCEPPPRSLRNVSLLRWEYVFGETNDANRGVSPETARQRTVRMKRHFMVFIV